MTHRLIALLLLLSAGPSAVAGARPAAPGADVLAEVRRLAPMQMDEVLWLARCLLSESDRPDEQRYVAWVVRNRVETRYRGYTYREVVLEPRQFSAFNDPSPRRTYLLSLDQHATGEAWLEALQVALDVYRAAPSERPFPVTVRHFYSPVSMMGRAEPRWAEDVTPLSSKRLGVDPDRFLFFAGVDPQYEDTPATEVRPEAAPVADRPVRLRPRSRRPTLTLGGTVARPRRPSVSRPGM